jgi:hypothetical protein
MVAINKPIFYVLQSILYPEDFPLEDHHLIQLFNKAFFILSNIMSTWSVK